LREILVSTCRVSVSVSLYLPRHDTHTTNMHEYTQAVMLTHFFEEKRKS
jgi:hypothetical protein